MPLESYRTQSKVVLMDFSICKRKKNREHRIVSRSMEHKFLVESIETIDNIGCVKKLILGFVLCVYFQKMNIMFTLR